MYTICTLIVICMVKLLQSCFLMQNSYEIVVSNHLALKVKYQKKNQKIREFVYIT